MNPQENTEISHSTKKARVEPSPRPALGLFSSFFSKIYKEEDVVPVSPRIDRDAIKEATNENKECSPSPK